MIKHSVFRAKGNRFNLCCAPSSRRARCSSAPHFDLFNSPLRILYQKTKPPRRVVLFLVEPRGIDLIKVSIPSSGIEQQSTGLLHRICSIPLFEYFTKKQNHPIGWFCFLVEPRGIEPLSESNLEGLSPGAVYYLHSLDRTGTNTLTASVAS